MAKIVGYSIAGLLLFWLGNSLGTRVGSSALPVEEPSLKVSQRVVRDKSPQSKDEDPVAKRFREHFVRYQDAQVDAKPLVETLHSFEDRKVEMAIKELHEALQSPDRELQLMALAALSASKNVVFDRAQFRPHAEKLIDGDDLLVRTNAWWMLYSCGVQEGDVERIRKMADDPDMVENVASLLVRFENYRLSPESSATLAQLLRTGGERVKRRAVEGLSSASHSKELSQALIDLSRSGSADLRFQIVDEVLSRTWSRTSAVTERLIEAMSNPREAESAAKGLRNVQDPRIATGMLQALVVREKGYVSPEALECVRRAKKEDLPLVRRALENLNLGSNARDVLREVEKGLTE